MEAVPRAGAAGSGASPEGAPRRRQGHPAVPARLRRARLSVYVDSSALVKLYVDEPGARGVRALDDLVVSSLARVEVAAALWRKHREGELSFDEAADLVTELEWDWFGDGERSVLARVPLTEAILDEAARCTARHPLRAADAIQLACALAARGADPDLGHFACFDERLAAAARSEGFLVIP